MEKVHCNANYLSKIDNVIRGIPLKKDGFDFNLIISDHFNYLVIKRYRQLA